MLNVSSHDACFLLSVREVLVSTRKEKEDSREKRHTIKKGPGTLCFSRTAVLQLNEALEKLVSLQPGSYIVCATDVGQVFGVLVKRFLVPAH